MQSTTHAMPMPSTSSNHHKQKRTTGSTIENVGNVVTGGFGMNVVQGYLVYHLLYLQVPLDKACIFIVFVEYRKQGASGVSIKVTAGSQVDQSVDKAAIFGILAVFRLKSGGTGLGRDDERQLYGYITGLL